MKYIEKWMIEAWLLGQMDIEEIYIKLRKTTEMTGKFSEFADEFLEAVLDYDAEIVQKGGELK